MLPYGVAQVEALEGSLVRWLLGVGAIDARMAAQVSLGTAALVKPSGWCVDADGW